jgi:YesN/AraC family two-component response regulator
MDEFHMFKVIVADDEYLEREVVKATVRRVKGAIVAGEGNCGEIAVTLCLALKPDLVFLNCKMGAVGGFDAAGLIRKSNKDVVIILTSADENNFVGEENSKLIRSLDVAECMLKPARTESIGKAVTKYMGRSSSNLRVSPKMKKHLRFYPGHVMSEEIRRALTFIDGHYNENIRLTLIAGEVCMSSYYFSRLFKKEVGVNLSQYILHKRLEKAKQMLAETERSIVDISASVGFREHNYFGKLFKKFVGATPSEYRKKSMTLKQERKEVREKYGG